MPTSGPISMSQIAAQLGVSTNSPLDLNNVSLRALLESDHLSQQTTGSIIRMSDAYGKSLVSLVTPGGAPGVISNDGLSLYLLSGSSFNIYARNPTTGNITFSSNFAFSANGDVLCMAISPDGKSLYCGTSNGQLITFSRNSTGEISYQDSVYLNDTIPLDGSYADNAIYEIAVSSDNLNVYCGGAIWFTDSQSSTPFACIYHYQRNDYTGALTVFTSFYTACSSAEAVMAFTLSSDGNTIYATNSIGPEGNIYAIMIFNKNSDGSFSVDNGVRFSGRYGVTYIADGSALSLLSGAPFDVPITPYVSLSNFLAISQGIALNFVPTRTFLNAAISNDRLLICLLTNVNTIVKYSVSGSSGTYVSEMVFDATDSSALGSSSTYGNIIFSNDNRNYYVVVNYSAGVYQFSR